eukprot:850518_1
MTEQAQEEKRDCLSELNKILTKRVKIIGICGSLRVKSFNQGLLRVLSQTKLDEIDFEIVPIGDLPLFNQDLENTKDESKDPETVQKFRTKIREADAIFFSSPEYNYGISSPLKNALDWASRGANGSCIKNKIATIIGAGGGGGTAKAQFQFRQTAVFLELRLINKPEIVIKAFLKDENGQMPVDFGTGDLIDEKWKKRVIAQIYALRDFYREQNMGKIAFEILSNKK